MNPYVRLSEFKAVVGSGATVTASDRRLLAKIEQVSREFDRDTGGNHLYAVQATRYYRQGAMTKPKSELFVDPIASLTSVAYRGGSGDSYTTLVLDTDYWTEPHYRAANEPIRRLVLNPEGALGAWPSADARAVKVIGLFGYSYELESTGLVVANASQIAADGTSLTVSDASVVDIGETLVIESEQVSVTDRPNTATLTIVRGINGTTAAAHATNTVIYRRMYPRDAVETLAERVRSLWSDEYKGGAPTTEFLGSTSAGNFVAWPRYRGLVAAYALGRAVV